MASDEQGELARIVLAVLFIGGLIAASFWILQPFLGALIWAVMIVIPTWPFMLGVERRLGKRRWAAVAFMALVLLVLLIAPLLAAVGTILTHVDDIKGWAKQMQDFKVPTAPAWLVGLPLVGERAAGLWNDIAAQGIESVSAYLSPYAGDLVRWVVEKMGSFGALFVQVLLTVVAAAVLYARGESAADVALRFGERLGGKHGKGAVRLSAQAIRGVALGVVVTALLQAIVGGAGLFIAGIPFAAVLTALIFLLAVAQIGGGPVMIVPILWLYWKGSVGWGTFLLVVGIITATIDNVVRPILIKRGADLPLLLIFVGVIGGLVMFGLIGIFVGPVVLAVSYTLLRAWLGVEEDARA